MDDLNDLRAAIVAEARSWLNTPYHHAAQIKGVGCDCAMFPAAVYHAMGLIGEPEFESYPQDWNLHRSEERYLSMVETMARPVTGLPEAGDFVLWRWGRCFAHGAIVSQWPGIIHAVRGQGVVIDDASRNARLADPSRDRLCFTVVGEVG